MSCRHTSYHPAPLVAHMQGRVTLVTHMQGRVPLVTHMQGRDLRHAGQEGWEGLYDNPRVGPRVTVRVRVRRILNVWVRVRVMVMGGQLLPTTSHCIFYSRVVQIAIFRHCPA